MSITSSGTLRTVREESLDSFRPEEELDCDGVDLDLGSDVRDGA
jgi:hypothetical protein